MTQGHDQQGPASGAEVSVSVLSRGKASMCSHQQSTPTASIRFARDIIMRRIIMEAFWRTSSRTATKGLGLRLSGYGGTGMRLPASGNTVEATWRTSRILPFWVWIRDRKACWS